MPLEDRLKHVNLITRLMYLGEAFFLLIAFVNLMGDEPFLGMRFISYVFGGIAIFQFLLVKFVINPMWVRKAHEQAGEWRPALKRKS